MAKHPDHYALVIGINDYAEKSRRLNGAINDAQAFINWLTTDQGGGLAPAHCLRLFSEPNPLMPGQDDIENRIEDLRNIVLTNHPDDGQAQRLYFYFSGHGTGISPSNVGLCYSHWSTSRSGALLSSSDYLAYLQNTGLFREIIVILDCCRSWEGSAGSPPRLTPEKPDAKRVADVKILTLYGSEFLARSIESFNADTSEVRGYFTSALIDGLNGKAAMPATGEVTVGYLRNYLEREVPLRSKNAQKPRFRINENLTDKFVLLNDTEERIDYRYDTSSFVRLAIEYDSIISADVVVYSVFNEICHEGSASRVVPLSKGRYFVVINYPTFMDSLDLDLLTDYTLRITGQVIPKVSPLKEVKPLVSIKHQVPTSSALIKGTAGTHETFGHPVERASKTPTHTILNGTGARLLIFVRHAHPTPDPTMTQKLALTDVNGQLCSVFADNDLFIEDTTHPDRHKQDGYFALSVKAKPGLYFLLYFGEKPRQLAIRLYKGRQTVVFMLYNQQPLFDTARVFLPRSAIGYQVYFQQQENLDLDTAIALFQTNQSFISPDIVRRLLHAKFEDPMLGVVGAYLLLRGRHNQEAWYAGFKNQIEEQHQTEIDYFSLIINNLQHLLGRNDPDVKTLRLLASDFIETFRAETFRFDQPPIITWGLRQLIERSATNSALIDSNSPILNIVTKVYSDCVYSSWQHSLTLNSLLEPRESSQDIKGITVDDSLKIAVCDQMIYFIKRAEKYNTPIQPEQVPSVQDIARWVGLPQLVIEAAIQELSRPDDWWWDDPTVIDQLGISTAQQQNLRDLIKSKGF